MSFIWLQSLIYGFGNAMTKVAFDSITPLWCLTIRFGMATLLFVLLFGKRIQAQLRDTSVKDFAPAGMCMALSYISCNVALDLTSATNVGFLMALPIIFTPFFAVVVLKESYRRAYIPVQLAVIAGLYLLCCNSGAFRFSWGELLALFTSASIAGSLVFGEQSLRKMDAVTVSAIQAGAAFAISLPGALLFEGTLKVSAIPPQTWGVVLYLALFCTLFAFSLQNMALKEISSVTVSTILCSQPVFTALVSWVLLGEKLGMIGMAGAAVILVCIFAGNRYCGGRPVLECPAAAEK